MGAYLFCFINSLCCAKSSDACGSESLANNHFSSFIKIKQLILKACLLITGLIIHKLLKSFPKSSSEIKMSLDVSFSPL